MKGLLLSGHDQADLIYGPAERAQIAEHMDLICLPWDGGTPTVDHPSMKEVEVIFFTGETPALGNGFLDRTPRLRAFFHAGRSPFERVDAEELWRRKVRVSSSDAWCRAAVADYAIGAILFGLKHGFLHAAHARKHGHHSVKQPVPGTFESTVGLFSLGATGRALLRRLRAFDLNVVVHDPSLSSDEARRLEIEPVTLDELFQRADAISLHTPDSLLPPGLVRSHHFASMKPGAVFINTAQPELVREAEMIRELALRPDLTAVLDITGAAPSAAGSALQSMPNVFLTPQLVSGEHGDQRWMGRCMIEEYLRWSSGQPLLREITKGEVVCRD